MQQVKKSTLKNDLYFTIHHYIKLNSKLLNYQDLSLKSKQALNYYVTTLKRKGYIKKVGYGTWEVVKKYDPEVKLKTTRVALNKSINLYDLTDINILKLKQILRDYNLDRCLFCNNRLYEIHHIIPKASGGTNSMYNLVPACPNHHQLTHKIGYTRNMKEKLREYHDFIDNTLKKTDMIRGHAFMFKLKVPSIRNWGNRDKFLLENNISFIPLDAGQKIIIKGRKIHIFNNSIIIYDKNNYLAKSSEATKSYAIQDLLEIIEAIEHLFKTSFKINNQYKFKVCRQHYGKLNDTLAKQYNKEGKKLKVFKEGGLWFVIDNSFNLDEAETVSAKTANKDMDNCIVPFFNSIKDKQGFTADFVLEAINKNTTQIGQVNDNMQHYAKNLKIHVAAIQELKDAVHKLTKKVGDFQKDI